MAWVRGAPADHDHWAYLGNAGWSYEDVLAHYRRIEDFDRGASDVHGAGGPIHVSTNWEPGAIHEAVVAAALEVGIPFNDDVNGRDPYGVGYLQYNIREGRRQSTSATYLGPLGASAPLEIVTGAHARRLLLDGTRCVGVEWEREGRLERARAAAEVVLCAGVIGSPHLLLLSGIGPARGLAEHGIAVAVDLPGVGENLHDHVHVPLVYSTERTIDAPAGGIPSMQVNVAWRTDRRLVAPDMQTAVFGEPVYRDGMHGPAQGLTLAATLVRPVSRGRLTLASPDPACSPSLDPATYDCAADLEKMVAAVRLNREIGAAATTEPRDRRRRRAARMGGARAPPRAARRRRPRPDRVHPAAHLDGLPPGGNVQDGGRR
jgi:choline dehydrogenase